MGGALDDAWAEPQNARVGAARPGRSGAGPRRGPAPFRRSIELDHTPNKRSLLLDPTFRRPWLAVEFSFLGMFIPLGFDLVWFGIIVIVIAELGLVTPPMGLNAFVVSKYSNTPATEVFRGIVPHVFSHLVVIALLLAFPAIVLRLPTHM